MKKVPARAAARTYLAGDSNWANRFKAIVKLQRFAATGPEPARTRSTKKELSKIGANSKRNWTADARPCGRRFLGQSYPWRVIRRVERFSFS
jgi:hypothetical protein